MSRNLNPSDISFFSLVLEDFKTHRRDPLSQGFIALFVHRLGNLIKGVSPFFLQRLLWVGYRLVNRFAEFVTGVTILHYSKVGRRVHIWHHSGIIINADCIGNDVVIRQNTTIGERAGVEGRPRISDGVDIGCGAVILGPVVVGCNSAVGANAVVVDDVPAGAVVVGVPARVLNKCASSVGGVGAGDAAS